MSQDHQSTQPVWNCVVLAFTRTMLCCQECASTSSSSFSDSSRDGQRGIELQAMDPAQYAPGVAMIYQQQQQSVRPALDLNRPLPPLPDTAYSEDGDLGNVPIPYDPTSQDRGSYSPLSYFEDEDLPNQIFTVGSPATTTTSSSTPLTNPFDNAELAYHNYNAYEHNKSDDDEEESMSDCSSASPYLVALVLRHPTIMLWMANVADAALEDGAVRLPHTWDLYPGATDPIDQELFEGFSDVCEAAYFEDGFGFEGDDGEEEERDSLASRPPTPVSPCEVEGQGRRFYLTNPDLSSSSASDEQERKKEDEVVGLGVSVVDSDEADENHSTASSPFEDCPSSSSSSDRIPGVLPTPRRIPIESSSSSSGATSCASVHPSLIPLPFPDVTTVRPSGRRSLIDASPTSFFTPFMSPSSPTYSPPASLASTPTDVEHLRERFESINQEEKDEQGRQRFGREF